MLAIALTFFFTCYLALAYGLGLYLFPVLLPDMQASLGFDYTTIGLMSGAAQAGYMVAALLSGALTPRIGGTRLVFLSIFACAVTLACLSQVTGPWLLGAGLTMLGAAAASIWVPMVDVVARFIPERNRATVFGVFSSGGGYGALVNGMVVPGLLLSVGWRSVWLVLGLATLALALIGGIILYRFGIFARHASMTAAAKTPALRGAATLLRSRLVLLLWTLMFFICIAYLPFQTYLAAYLRTELSFSVQQTGALWTVFGLAAAVGGAALGLLADRIGIRRAMAVTLALLLVAALVLACYPQGWLPFAAAAAYGISYGAIYGLTPAYVARMLPLQVSSPVFGFGNVLIGLGGVAGNVLGGYSKSMTGSLHYVYLGVAAATVLLLIITWRLDDDRLRG